MTSRSLETGIFCWFGFVMPLPERLRLIKEAGFEATSVWWEDEVGPRPIKKELIPYLVRESGLILENVHVAYETCNRLWSEDPFIRAFEVDRYVCWIEDCARYGIDMMVMHLTDGPFPPGPPKCGLDSMRRIVNFAEQAGVVVAVENTEQTQYLRLVFKEIESSFLGFCYDSSHDRLHGLEHSSLLRDLGGRLVATHLSDNDGMQDRHWLPGDGVIDWNNLKKAFPWSTYRGKLSLEVCADGAWQTVSPGVFLKSAYQRLRRMVEVHSTFESAGVG